MDRDIGENEIGTVYFRGSTQHQGNFSISLRPVGVELTLALIPDGTLEIERNATKIFFVFAEVISAFF